MVCFLVRWFARFFMHMMAKLKIYMKHFELTKKKNSKQKKSTEKKEENLTPFHFIILQASSTEHSTHIAHNGLSQGKYFARFNESFRP